MRFLVDENLPPEQGVLLEAAGHDVYVIKGSAHEGSSDAVITALSMEQRRILITRDLDFPLRGAAKLNGLILLRLPFDAGRDHIVPKIRELMSTEELERAEGRITVVSSSSIRWRSIRDG